MPDELTYEEDLQERMETTTEEITEALQEYAPELELLPLLMPEPGLVVMGDVTYPLFYDILSLREVEKHFQTNIFGMEMKEEDLSTEDFLVLLSTGMQGGVRRQWRMLSSGDEEPKLRTADVSKEKVEELFNDYADFVGNGMTALSMIWMAVRMAWNMSIRPAYKPVPRPEGAGEGSGENPPAGA